MFTLIEEFQNNNSVCSLLGLFSPSSSIKSDLKWKSVMICVLVTAVPLPGVSGSAGQEVGRPLILHPLSEPQQNSGVIISRVASRAGKQRLFMSKEQIHNL